MNIKVLIFFMTGLLFCSCQKGGDAETVQNTNVESESNSEPNEFEKKLIQRFEANKREADQIRDRIGLSSGDSDPTNIDADEKSNL
jgi:hypothetical protein